MVKITVQPRSSSKKSGKPARPAVEIDFPSRHPNAVTVDELKGAVEAKFPKVRPPGRSCLSPRLTSRRGADCRPCSVLPGGWDCCRQLVAVRQRLTTETNSVLADGDKSLGSYGVKEEDTLYLKDLGRQISWRNVFVIEYVRGPLRSRRSATVVGELTTRLLLSPARTARHPPDVLLLPQPAVRAHLLAHRRAHGPVRDVRHAAVRPAQLPRARATLDPVRPAWPTSS